MEIVSFEISKKLKEKGFREKCFAYYAPYDATLFYNKSNFRGGIVDDCLYSYNSLRESVSTSELIDAPTISQVLKWLREEKRIEVNACWDNIDAQWIRYASEMDKPDLVGYYTTIDYDSYEQAAIAGIEYVLDNLI